MNANSVASFLAKHKVQGHMKESILERSLMNANSVASVLSKQEV